MIQVTATGPQGHQLSIGDDGRISLRHPDGNEFHFDCPGGIWDSLTIAQEPPLPGDSIVLSALSISEILRIAANESETREQMVTTVVVHPAPDVVIDLDEPEPLPPMDINAVSYTHLTLPTICSV